jgi:hypothetical protein
MGSQSKYASKNFVYVPCNIGEPTGDPPVTPISLNYGFLTNIPDADRTTLGQVALNIKTPPAKLVIGTSFPKPPRASLRQALRFTSSFCGKDKIAALKAAGWVVTKSKRKARIITTDSALVKTVYVKILGINYAWQIPKVTQTNAGALTDLGIVEANIADADELCFGANFPIPPRAYKTIAPGNATTKKTISTFYDPDKTAAAGWMLRGGGRLTLT